MARVKHFEPKTRRCDLGTTVSIRFDSLLLILVWPVLHLRCQRIDRLRRHHRSRRGGVFEVPLVVQQVPLDASIPVICHIRFHQPREISVGKTSVRHGRLSDNSNGLTQRQVVLVTPRTISGGPRSFLECKLVIKFNRQVPPMRNMVSCQRSYPMLRSSFRVISSHHSL